MNTNDKNTTATYFPLHTTHYTSEISLDIRMNFGLEAYAAYIILLQKLTNTPDRKLKLESIKLISYEIHFDLTTLTEIVNKYFDTDETNFYSNNLNNQLLYFDEKYNKSSLAGKKSAEKLTPEQRTEKAKKASNIRWSNDQNANDMLTLSINDANPQHENTNPQHVDANNRIEENRIEKNRIEKNGIEKNGIEEKGKEKNRIEENGIEEKEKEKYRIETAEPDFSTAFSEIPNQISNHKSDFVSEYFNENNTKLLVDIYNRNINKLRAFTLSQFDKLMLISIVIRLKLENQKLPSNSDELQMYGGMISLNDFKLITEFCTSKKEEDIETIQFLIDKFKINNTSTVKSQDTN
jgi:hypothetical protein